MMNSISIQFTLAQTCIQIMLPEQFQSQPRMFHMLHMFHMFFLILRITKDAIKENKNKPARILIENIIHEAHRCSWCICETKWYHYNIITSIPCSEGCLMNIFILDPYLLVTIICSISCVYHLFPPRTKLVLPTGTHVAWYTFLLTALLVASSTLAFLVYSFCRVSWTLVFLLLPSIFTIHCLESIFLCKSVKLCNIAEFN